jgi:hypothetical protein
MHLDATGGMQEVHIARRFQSTSIEGTAPLICLAKYRQEFE